MERMTGFEPAALGLGSRCSISALHPQASRHLRQPKLVYASPRERSRAWWDTLEVEVRSMRRRGLGRRRRLMGIDNPDDAELMAGSLTGDETLVGVDSPDDVDIYLTGDMYDNDEYYSGDDGFSGHGDELSGQGDEERWRD